MRYAWTLLFKIISYLSTYLRTTDSPSHFAIYLGWFCGYFGSRPSTTTLDKFWRLVVWHWRCVWRNSCTRAKCFSRLIIDISLPKLSFDRYNFLVYWDIYSWLMISIFEANYYYCLLKKKQTSVYRKLDPKWTTLAWTYGTQFYSGPHLNQIILWRTVVQAEKRTIQSSACPRWLTGKIFVISPLGLLPLVPDSSLPAVEYNRNNSLG